MSFVIDGTEYGFPCDIKRTANLRASDVSGFLLNGDYLNDVLGTYMEYEVSMAIPVTMMDEYASLYEVLSDPVAQHVFDLPYNQGILRLVGRIETVSDSYVRKVRETEIWRSTTFNIIANRPTKMMVDGDVQDIGVTIKTRSLVVSANGTYEAGAYGVDGFSSVTADVHDVMDDYDLVQF